MGEENKWLNHTNMICVPVYADSTGQYIEEECDFDNCVNIPVPKDMMLQFFEDIGEPMTEDELNVWEWEESTCDDTIYLMDWLEKHNYNWKRLN